MQGKGKKKRILVVEDDPDMIKLHVDFLSDRFSVVFRSSGARAVRYVKNHPEFDLVIVDINLADMSGLEVLKSIKRTMPFVPAIVMAGFGSEDLAIRAFRSGARDYVKKPFLYDEFLKRIEFCLSLHRIGQAKRRKTLTSEPDERADDAGRTRAAKNNYPIQRAMRYINNNFATDICLDRAAETACLSRYHFSRLFKETAGLTYQNYLNQVRIEQAKKLLDHGALSITDSGYAVGYSDLTHFGRIFKKLVGATPSQYRHQTTARRDAL